MAGLPVAISFCGLSIGVTGGNQSPDASGIDMHQEQRKQNRLKHQAGTGDSLLRIDSAASGLGDQSHRAESQAGWRTRIYASDS